jgi:hypothetical protein
VQRGAALAGLIKLPPSWKVPDHFRLWAEFAEMLIRRGSDQDPHVTGARRRMVRRWAGM